MKKETLALVTIGVAGGIGMVLKYHMAGEGKATAKLQELKEVGKETIYNVVNDVILGTECAMTAIEDVENCEFTHNEESEASGNEAEEGEES